MAEPESTQTMQHDSFKKQGDGTYAMQVAGVAGGAASTVSLATTGNTVKLDQVDPNNRVATIPNPAANLTSLSDASSVAAPGAAAVIATVALAIGTWDIECWTFIGGTTVATLEATNMRLALGATPIGRILNPVPGTTGGVGIGRFRARIVVAAGANAQIIAVAAATAASLYSASIVANRVV